MSQSLPGSRIVLQLSPQERENDDKRSTVKFRTAAPILQGKGQRGIAQEEVEVESLVGIL